MAKSERKGRGNGSGENSGRLTQSQQAQRHSPAIYKMMEASRSGESVMPCSKNGKPITVAVNGMFILQTLLVKDYPVGAKPYFIFNH